MQSQLFIDTKLKGNVLIRQLCSKGKKTTTTQQANKQKTEDMNKRKRERRH